MELIIQKPGAAPAIQYRLQLASLRLGYLDQRRTHDPTSQAQHGQHHLHGRYLKALAFGSKRVERHYVVVDQLIERR